MRIFYMHGSGGEWESACVLIHKIMYMAYPLICRHQFVWQPFRWSVTTGTCTTFVSFEHQLVKLRKKTYCAKREQASAAMLGTDVRIHVVVRDENADASNWEIKVEHPLSIFLSLVFRKKILSRRIMEETVSKFHGTVPGSWGSH